MYIRRTMSVAALWHFGWRNALRMAILSAAVYAAHDWLHWKWLAIPFLPVSTVGAAVAFYVGFKNNSAYERLWEARRIWGGITNTSRSFAMSVRSLAGHRCPDKGQQLGGLHRELVYRQLAWVNALRIQLRRPSALNANLDNLPHVTATRHLERLDHATELDTILERFVPDNERASLQKASTVTNLLLASQADRLGELKRSGALDEYEHSDIMKHVVECVHHQGAAERIKTFPFPRQYANFSIIFVNTFLTLLPFGLIREMSSVGPGSTWMVIPFSILIGWVFYTMEQVGDSSENPFENALNDIPLDAMCRNMEIDLRELLGESNLPQRLQPVDGVLL